MSSAPAETGTCPQPSTSSSPPPRESGGGPRFSKLRSVQWRINLGILPSSDSSIEDLRRVAADSRRRYASLRRRLLIDPHIFKDEDRSPNLVVDNPLSQNPDSMWGRFFKNAELEKMVDQDLSRLYPEHGSYFQTPTCQAMLRRILLLWCLRHPDYGYGQGMHELLAPLLFVLHVDVQCLLQVQKLHEDQFSDEFDTTYFKESDILSNHRSSKNTNLAGETEQENKFQGTTSKGSNLDELDPDTRDIILLSDAYGAEGELGILLSERFMEHDAYCMFDVLMNGGHGGVAMAEFFSPSPSIGSCTGLPPVIEASSALYHLLAVVDSYLHSHLVELGVEPQYFAMRWLRVLFGREFSLSDLLVIWDEIFSSPNSKYPLHTEYEVQFSFGILSCPRGAFISAMAVSMILHFRSSLLATENATSCLQRLLNFPENINLKKLIGKAKSLQALALDANVSSSLSGTVSDKINSPPLRGHSLSSDSVSPKTPLYSVPESYWEEKWRVMHKAEEQNGGQSQRNSKGFLKNPWGRERFSLLRTESDPSPAKKKDSRSSVRRRLLDDLSQEVDSDLGNSAPEGNSVLSGIKAPLFAEENLKGDFQEDSHGQNTMEKNLDYLGEETCLSGENSSLFSAATSPLSITHDNENDSEKSSVTSTSHTGDNDVEVHPAETCCSNSSNLILRHSETTLAASIRPEPNMDAREKQVPLTKERKLLFGKFQWLLKFGRGAGEGNLEKVNVEAQRSPNEGNTDVLGPSSVGGNVSARADKGDKKASDTLKNLAQSMLENIEVIESLLQQDQHQVDSLENNSSDNLGGEGEVTATSALKELRKISSLLSQMSL